MKESKKTYIGYASDKCIRYKSSSGGVTTAAIKYLFQSGQIQTALGCTFNQPKCMYEPKLIYSYEEYELTGSVYQEMDIIGFIRCKIEAIMGKILVICAPCQVRAIRSILHRVNIENIIIDYFCSGQTTLEGTYCYYKFLGIDKSIVTNIHYRSNGWPNGIEIFLKNGSTIKRDNYTEPWVTIHQSGLFKPKRCHYCKLAESEEADISVGDPWLKEYKEDNIGNTLFLTHTQTGEELTSELEANKDIIIVEVDYSLYEIAQKSNIKKRQNVKENKKAINKKVKMISNDYYFNWAVKNMHNMSKHNKLMTRMFQYYKSSNRTFIENIKILINKALNKVKSH